MQVEIKKIDPLCPHCDEVLRVVYVNPELKAQGY